ncbi:MAG: hypothetical protein ABSH20_12790 [Tepidisphaeraceae bacterium]
MTFIAILLGPLSLEWRRPIGKPKPGGNAPNMVAESTLDDGFMASPAVSGSALHLRTRSHFYRIEK